MAGSRHNEDGTKVHSEHIKPRSNDDRTLLLNTTTNHISFSKFTIVSLILRLVFHKKKTKVFSIDKI